MFISMRKYLRHPHMCTHSPIFHILFYIPLLATNIFICILEMNLAVVIVTWCGWWRIVLGEMAHVHVCIQRVWRAGKIHSHVDAQPWRCGVTKQKALPFTPIIGMPKAPTPLRGDHLQSHGNNPQERSLPEDKKIKIKMPRFSSQEMYGVIVYFLFLLKW